MDRDQSTDESVKGTEHEYRSLMLERAWVMEMNEMNIRINGNNEGVTQNVTGMISCGVLEDMFTEG